MTTTKIENGSWLLQFIENSWHPFLKGSFGVDMDQVQAKVVDKLPPFDWEHSLKFTAVVVVFWFVMFLFLHFVIIKPFFSALKGSFAWADAFDKLSWNKKCYFTSYVHGIVHAILSAFLGFYCVAYADGKPGTTWFDGEY